MMWIPTVLLTFTIQFLPTGASAIVPTVATNQQTQSVEPVDPFGRRPVCNAMYLATDRVLSAKQRACDWVQNGVFSGSGMAAAVWSASTSPWWTKIVGGRKDPNGFPLRLAVDFGQNAFKSTGAYLGSLISREDPRVAPPYLTMLSTGRPTGFLGRTWHALSTNVMTYRCDSPCLAGSQIHRAFALSSITGSLASGFSIGVLSRDHSDLRAREWRGVASAYAATFVNRILVEFKPELGRFAGAVIGGLFGVR